MSDRLVGEADRTLANWRVNGQLVTSGSAWARYSRINAGALEYLQADDSWSATLHEFVLSLGAEGFGRFFVWPASARNRTVYERARHGVYGLSRAFEHRIRALDADLSVDDHAIDAGGVLRVLDSIDHATVLASYQLYDSSNAPAPFGKGAVRRVRL